jgi:hypothetical protein
MPKDFNELIRILQYRTVNVIYSFLALESFMNDSIPENYTFTNSKWKIRDKKYIQEKFSTDIKFKEVLVDIYKLNNLDEEILNDYCNLKDIRDKITHLKQIDTVESWINDDTIWKILFDKNFINYSIVTKNIIWYFFNNINNKEIPRWFKKINF